MSNNSEQPKTIQTKKEAGSLSHLIEPNADQAKIILNHIHSIGADDHILTEDDELNYSILQKYFYQLVIRNKWFPMDMPIAFVLGNFFEAILQGEVPLKGFNLKAHIESMHSYLEENEPTLRAKWYHMQNPEDRPQQLPESSVVQEAESTTAERSEKLKQMYRGNVPEHLKKYMEEDTNGDS